MSTKTEEHQCILWMPKVAIKASSWSCVTLSGPLNLSILLTNTGLHWMKIMRSLSQNRGVSWLEHRYFLTWQENFLVFITEMRCDANWFHPQAAEMSVGGVGWGWRGIGGMWSCSMQGVFKSQQRTKQSFYVSGNVSIYNLINIFTWNRKLIFGGFFLFVYIWM